MPCCVRMLAYLVALGGVVSVVLVWSHSHPHPVWSLWTVSDLCAVVLLVIGLRRANERIGSEAAAGTAAVLAEQKVP